MSRTTRPLPSAAGTQSRLTRERIAVPWWCLLVVVQFAALFLYYNYIPIFHSDIWGHVGYGRWILDHGRLPTEDPFLALAEGVPVVDTAWLGQVVFAAAERAGGPEWIPNLFALTVLATYLLLARTFDLQTGRLLLACGGAVLVWLVAWSRHAIVRPEIFGSLCFAGLLWLLVRSDHRRRPHVAEIEDPAHRTPWALWLGVPVLFAAWANLHGSFVVGFAVLGCEAAGRVLDVIRRRWSPLDVLRDREFRRWLVVGELAVAATLLNPYGIDLLIHTFLFPGNPNLDDVLEWFRLEMVSMEGISVGFSWVLLTVLLRHSRARVRPADVLLLAVFVVAVCLRVRMTTWYAPVVVLVMMPHAADVTDRLRNASVGAWLSEKLAFFRRRSFNCTLLCGLVIWVSFAFSPTSRFVLGGKPRPERHVYSQGTPLRLTEFLHELRPQGQIANPQWWGDWLVLKGPDDLQVLMTTNAVHVVPQRVWRDYLAIARGQSGLEDRLDRYRINTIVVHKELQRTLTRRVRRMDGWRVVYEDDLGLVAVRGRQTDTPADDAADPSDQETAEAG